MTENHKLLIQQYRPILHIKTITNYTCTCRCIELIRVRLPNGSGNNTTFYNNFYLVELVVSISLSSVSTHSWMIELTSSGFSSCGQCPEISNGATWENINRFIAGTNKEIENQSCHEIPASNSLIMIPSQCSLSISNLDFESEIGSFIP